MSAKAPVACGAAIEVPLKVAYTFFLNVLKIFTPTILKKVNKEFYEPCRHPSANNIGRNCLPGAKTSVDLDIVVNGAVWSDSSTAPTLRTPSYAAGYT